MELFEAKNKFVQAWGSFGSEWGINRTMAQIHGLLLVTEEPLTTDDLMDQLKISRGNVNMNVRTLIDWNLVWKSIVSGDRRDYFIADKDIWNVAKKISIQRRQRELEPILRVLKDVEGLERADKENTIFLNQIHEISDFATSVDGMLRSFENTNNTWVFKNIIKIMK